MSDTVALWKVCRQLQVFAMEVLVLPPNAGHCTWCAGA